MVLQKRIKKYKNWQIIDIIYSTHWVQNSYNVKGFVHDYPRLGGGNFLNTFVGIMENKNCKYIYDFDEFDKVANFTSNRLISDEKWRKSVYKNIDYYSEQYFDAGEKFQKLPFSKLSNQDIIKELNTIFRLQRWHHVYSVLVNGPTIDAKNHLSNKIRQELQTEIKETNRFNKYWSLLTLTTKMSLNQRKNYALAKLAEQVGKKSDLLIQKKLKRLHKKYCWLSYTYLGPPASLEQYQKDLKAASKKNTNLNLPKQLTHIKRKQDILIKKLGLTKRAKFLINLAQFVLLQKGFRKDVQYHGFYCYEPLFRELAKKHGTNVWQSFAYLLPWEFKKFIKKGIPTIHTLKRRMRLSCLVVKRKTTILLGGEKAKLFVKKLNLKKTRNAITEATGLVAFAGRARGIVKIVRIPADVKKMNQGDILVSQATTPDLLPAIKKAAAIVTNLGGLICHAAIVARELKVPCVVGTMNATEIFQDGDLVEVDATTGIIKRAE